MPGNQRVLRWPPADFAGLKIGRTRQQARNWFRVHPSHVSAANFSLAAHHRFSHKDCPYPLLYLGLDVETCLFERFGDLAYDGNKAIPRALWDAHSISIIQVPEIPACDLTNAKTLSAMRVDLATLMHNDISAPQAWGLEVQKHPTTFQAIKYKSRFNGKACLALFKRDGIESHLDAKVLAALPNSAAAVDWLAKYGVALY